MGVVIVLVVIVAIVVIKAVEVVEVGLKISPTDFHCKNWLNSFNSIKYEGVETC